MNSRVAAVFAFPLAPWLRLSLASLAYFFAQVVAFKFPDSFGLMASIWPAAGIALAAMLLCPRPHQILLLGCLFVSGLAANLTTDRPVIASVGFMVANIGETAGSAWLVMRLCGSDIRFNRVREIFALAAAAIFVNAGTALIGAGAAQIAIGAQFGMFYWNWWVADGLGLLFVTPMILIGLELGRAMPSKRMTRILETIGVVTVGGFVAWYVFGPRHSSTPIEIQAYMLMPVIIWAAFRSGISGVLLLLGVVAMIAIGITHVGHSSFPLGGADVGHRLLSVQFFLGVLGLTGMLLAAAISQQRESQTLLQAVMEGSSDAIFAKDPAGRYLLINSAAARMVGHRAAEVLGKDDNFLFPPEKAGELMLRDQGVLAMSVPWTGEEAIVDPAGETKVLLSIKGALRNDDGEVMGVFGIARDITLRKQVENKLRDEQERLRTILDTVGDPIFVKDYEHRIILANEAFYRIFGLNEASVIGRTLAENVPAGEQEKFLAIDRRVLDTGVSDLREESLTVGAQQRTIITRKTRFIEHSGEKFLVGSIHDITERMQAEAARRESEIRYQTLFEKATIGIVYITPDLKIRAVNEAYAQMHGYSIEEMLTMTIRDVDSPEAFVQAPERLARMLAGEKLDFTIEHLHRDGHRFPVEISVSVINFGGDDIIQAFTRDVTARRLAEEALNVSEAKFRAIFDASPVPMALNDLAGHITYLNPAFTRTFGYDQADLPTLEAWWPKAYPDPEYRRWVATQWMQELSRARETGTEFHPMELRIQCKGGGERFVLAGAAALSRDYRDNHLVLLYDITERKKAERELGESQTRLASVINSAMDAIITVDSRGQILIFNPAAESMFRLARAEALGQSLERFMPERFRSAHRGHVAGYADHGMSTRAMGKPNMIFGLRADGEEFPLEASISRVRHGDETLLTVILRDISVRVRAEKEKAAVEDQLRQSQKLESLGTLAGGIAHDFNNILAGITGFTSLARQADTAAEQMDYLGEIDRAGQRAAKLVQQILSFSRRDKQDLTPMQLRHVVAEAVALLRATIPSTIEFAVNLAGDLPPVLGNPTQLHQVVMNLGTNAWHAMRERGGKLTVSLESQLIDASFARTLTDISPGIYVRLTLRDTGCGMDEATLARVFEPFFTTKGPGEGTGLGLSVLHGIVRSHQGAVRLASIPGQGTTVEIYLPAITSSTTPPSESSEEIQMGNGERILFVDDEVTLTRFAVLALRQMGYQVESETQALKALARLEQDPQAFHLVMTDQTMPSMTGLEFASKIRALRSDLPVIIMSGYSLKLTPANLGESGVAEVLAKPFTKATLAAVIQRHIAKKPTA